LFRTGLVGFSPGPLVVHAVFHEVNYSASSLALIHMLWRFIGRLQLIGPLGIVAVGGILVTGWTRRHSVNDGRLTVLFAGLISSWLLWFVLMANHAFVHDYQMLLAVPVGGAALGVGLVALIDLVKRAENGSTLAAMRLVTLVIIPMVMLMPLTRETKDRLVASRDRYEHSGVTYAWDIKSSTEPGAVVMIPDVSMVPVYYSKRHIIRGVADDSIVEKVVGRVGQVFPRSTTYLALSPGDLKKFPRSLGQYPAIARTKHLVLLALPRGDTSALARKPFVFH